MKTSLNDLFMYRLAAIAIVRSLELQPDSLTTIAPIEVVTYMWLCVASAGDKNKAKGETLYRLED